jgi:hypothetical protein
MLETAAWADHAGGASLTGRGEMRRWRALYASAEVEEEVLSLRVQVLERRAAFEEMDRIARRAAIAKLKLAREFQLISRIEAVYIVVVVPKVS